jgi:hypothetical protein
MVAGGATAFGVAELAREGDPAYLVVKTLRVEYQIGGKDHVVSATDPETIAFELPAEPQAPARIVTGRDGKLSLHAATAGAYEAVTASGKSMKVTVSADPPADPVQVAWEVRFPPGTGAPERLVIGRLQSLSEHPEPGVRYFSGTARYQTQLPASPKLFGANRRQWLDLGRVEVCARVKLNGRDLDILWKAPYRVDVTGILKPGDNRLEIEVTNLPVNRMLGDEQLPEDSARNPNGTLKEWPQWVKDGRPSPTGRLTFTTWRLWRKDEKPVPSGLLGPLTLRATQVFPLPP